MTSEELSLPEQFLLLCLNDKTGACEVTYAGYGLRGAAMAELLLRQSIVLQDAGLHVLDHRPTGDDLLDRALRHITATPTTRSVASWLVELFPEKPSVTDALTMRLTQRGVLRSEEKRSLWVFRQQIHPTANSVPKEQLRERLRGVVMGEVAEEARWPILIALLNGCRALYCILTEKEIRQHKQRIEEIARAHPISYAVGQAITEILAAITARRERSSIEPATP